MENDKILLGRMTDLDRKANCSGRVLCSDFLTLAEQFEVRSRSYDTPLLFEGGFPSAERKIAIFNGTGGEIEKNVLPLAFVRVGMRSDKYAEALTHRDYLGSLLSLGVVREKIGDILVYEKEAYIVCLDVISDFLISNCSRIRKTDVLLSKVDLLPERALTLPDPVRVVVSSCRIDGLISAAFKLSREKCKELILSEKVFVNGSPEKRPDADLKSGDVLSVRGFGRIVPEGTVSETKKGRLAVSLRIFR